MDLNPQQVDWERVEEAASVFYKAASEFRSAMQEFAVQRKLQARTGVMPCNLALSDLAEVFESWKKVRL